MFFKTLSPELQNAVRALTKDAVFQKRFAEDGVLDELDAEKFDPAKVFPDLLSFLGHRRVFGKTYLKPITPAMWCYLWSIDNPIVSESKKQPTQADFDLFFYLLEFGVKDIPLVEMVTHAVGFCQKSNLSDEVVSNALSILINEAFAPLKMFPKSPEEKKLVGNDIVPFDAEWLSGMISKVHSVTGYTPDHIMNQMSMNAVCYYYIQYCRNNGAKGIERRTSLEIMEAQAKRASELIVDYLIEKGIMKPEEREAILKQITTPPEI